MFSQTLFKLKTILLFPFVWVKDKVSLCFSLYITHPSLFLYDLTSFAHSLLHNPYTILNKRSLGSILRRGEVYGETPWHALNKICKEFGISSSDAVIDLGSGLGKVCFWFAHVVGCEYVTGVDREKDFIDFSKKAVSTLASRLVCVGRLQFLLGDFTEISFSRYTVVYFYGTSFSSKVIRKLINSLTGLRKGACVITVSYPLTEFSEGNTLFFVEKATTVSFPWGRAEVFKNVRK